MSFKKTLILSVLLHLCFFTAVLFLSADLLMDSSKLLDEKVFFVNILEDMKESKSELPVVKTKKLKPEKSQLIKVKLEDENVIPAANIPLTDHGTGKDEIADILDGRETVVNISYSSFSSESKKITKGSKDNEVVLPTETIEIIRNYIEKAKTYPLLARKRGIEGTVFISFRISSQGEPQDLKILKGSGSRILDTATLDIVKKAAPFPYVESTIEVPVVFRLN